MTGTVTATFEGITRGTVTFRTNTADGVLRDPAGNVLWVGPKKVRLVGGLLEVDLPATDDTAYAETDWQWCAEVKPDGRSAPFLRWFELPDASTVDLADIAGELAPGDPLTHPLAYADVVADIQDPESVIGTALAAAIDAGAEVVAAANSAPLWKASTAYAAGAVVLSPYGSLIRAKAAFTSGATYDASKWLPAYDVNDWIGNLAESSLQSWQWGTSARLSIAFYGDSITQGAWAGTTELTDWPVKGFVGKFQQAIQRIYGNGGLGFVGLFRKEWVKAGTWTQVSDYAPFGQCWAANAASDTYTLTTKAGDGDNLDIFYVDTSAAFTYTIDGGSPVTITPPGGASNQTIKTNVTLPDDGAHVIEIQGPTSGNTYLVGAALYRGTTGAVVHNLGKSGAGIGDLIGFSRLQVIPLLAPRLNIIGFVANDRTAQTALATYKSRLTTLVTACEAQGDTALTIPPDNGLTPGAITLAQYEAALKEVAVAEGVPWFDIHAAWGAYAGATAKMYDTQHPNETGHNDIAARLLRVLRRVA